MIKLGIAGAAGRMGQTIILSSKDFSDIEVDILFEHDKHPLIGSPIHLNNRQVTVQKASEVDFSSCSAVIDFTTPESTVENLRRSSESSVAFVIGTTGFSEDQLKFISSESEKRPILLAPNMSLGANLMFALAKKAAQILGESYNPEIVEAHHKHKKDAPSGTAKRLGQAIAEGLGWDYDEVTKHGRNGITGERPVKEIGMHVIRGGEIVGDHQALFAGIGENLEIRHTAFSREAFARGALRAAQFVNKHSSGQFDMFDVLGLEF